VVVAVVECRKIHHQIDGLLLLLLLLYQVTYDQKKKDVKEWLPLVAAARQAETLNFAYEPRLNTTEATIVGKFTAETDMEVSAGGSSSSSSGGGGGDNCNRWVGCNGVI